jgi:hypothetical protein
MRRQREYHPAGLHPQDQKYPADRLGGKSHISEPARKADADEETGGAGEPESTKFQHQAVRQVHDAERDAKQKSRETGLLGLSHGDFPFDANAYTLMQLHQTCQTHADSCN